MKYPTIDVTELMKFCEPSIAIDGGTNMSANYNEITTEENRNNLSRLTDWLANHDVAFDISMWRSETVETDTLKQCVQEQNIIVMGERSHCGTSACAVGWAPFAFPEIDLKEYEFGVMYNNKVHNRIDYTKMLDELFGDHIKVYMALFTNDWLKVTRLIDRSLRISDRMLISSQTLDKILFIFRARLALCHGILVDGDIGYSLRVCVPNAKNDNRMTYIKVATDFVKEYLNINSIDVGVYHGD